MSCFVTRMERKQQRRQAMEITRQQPQAASGEGVYACSKCGNALFEEQKKFDSRTGFPSFWMHLGHGVEKKRLTTYGRERTQLLCSQCGQHLGHLFSNKHTSTKLRYCINGEAIKWVAAGV